MYIQRGDLVKIVVLLVFVFLSGMSISMILLDSENKLTGSVTEEPIARVQDNPVCGVSTYVTEADGAPYKNSYIDILGAGGGNALVGVDGQAFDFVEGQTIGFSAGIKITVDLIFADGVDLTVICECQDGIDNDGDGQTDGSDPHCVNDNDDEEDVAAYYPVSVVCTDSDGGPDKTVKGTTTGINYVNGEEVTWTDFCSNGALVEYWCPGPGETYPQYAFGDVIGCDGNDVCDNGICVECVQSSDCSQGVCTPDNTCVECNSDLDCTDSFCSEDNECLECITNTNCETLFGAGYSCSGGNVCTQDNECTVDTDCVSLYGEGYTCDVGGSCDAPLPPSEEETPTDEVVGETPSEDIQDVTADSCFINEEGFVVWFDATGAARDVAGNGETLFLVNFGDGTCPSASVTYYVYTVGQDPGTGQYLTDSLVATVPGSLSFREDFGLDEAFAEYVVTWPGVDTYHYYISVTQGGVAISNPILVCNSASACTASIINVADSLDVAASVAETTGAEVIDTVTEEVAVVETTAPTEEGGVDCSGLWDCSGVGFGICEDGLAFRELTLCVHPDPDLFPECWSEDQVPEYFRECLAEDPTVQAPSTRVGLGAGTVEDVPIFSWVNIFLVMFGLIGYYYWKREF